MVNNIEISKKYKINSALESIAVFFVCLAVIILSSAAANPYNPLSGEILKFFLLLTSRISVFIATSCLLFCRINIGIKIILPIFFYLMCLINVYENNPIYPVGSLYCALFVNILVLKKKQFYFLFKLYRRYIIIMSLLGIIGYLSFLFALPIPFRIVDYYEPSEAVNYIDYGFCYIYSLRFFWLRLCGLFPEPGVYGVVIALLLCSDELNMKKISNIVLFIAGCLTFSIAFATLIIVYFLLKNIKNIKKIICLFISFVIIILFLYYLDNPVFNQGILRRLEFDNGKINADNRIDSKGNSFFYNNFLQNKQLFFGYGGGFAKTISGGSSYKMMMMDYGILGFFILNGLFVLIAVKQAGKDYRVYPFIICFFTLLYKSTIIISGINLVLLLGGIEYIKNNHRKKYHL